MVLNNKIEDPYTKLASNQPIPLVSKSIIKSKLSKKFDEIINLDIEMSFECYMKYLREKETGKLIDYIREIK